LSKLACEAVDTTKLDVQPGYRECQADFARVDPVLLHAIHEQQRTPDALRPQPLGMFSFWFPVMNNFKPSGRVCAVTLNVT